MNDVDFKYTNPDILEKMIKERLVVEYAKKQGLSVTNDEIEAYIKQVRSQLHSEEAPADIKEMMKNRIRISGLSEDQFYASPEIIQSYERMLYSTKVAELLLSQGKLVNPAQDFEKFQAELWDTSKDTIRINNNELININ